VRSEQRAGLTYCGMWANGPLRDIHESDLRVGGAPRAYDAPD
jgi:hypothetical protein